MAQISTTAGKQVLTAAATKSLILLNPVTNRAEVLDAHTLAQLSLYCRSDCACTCRGVDKVG